MPRPRGPSRPEVTRGKVVEAAGRLFGTYGYYDVSLAQIGQDVGITVPSITYYFPTKQSLFDEVLRVAWSELAETIRTVLTAPREPEVLLPELLGALLSFEAEKDGLFTAISTALLSHPGLGTQAINDTLIPLVDEIDGHLRQNTRGTIHPDAPLRETILYIAAGHAAQHLMSQQLPSLTSKVLGHEPFIVTALLKATMAWTPDAASSLMAGR